MYIYILFYVCLYMCVCVCCCCLVAKSCTTFMTPQIIDCQAPLSMDFPGQNTGVGCHFLLQVIFSTQASNTPLPVLQVDYQCHLGSPHVCVCIHTATDNIIIPIFIDEKMFEV